MGLDALKAKRAAAEREKVDNWLTLKPNEDAEIVFLQELEDTADEYQVDEWTVNGNGKFATLVDTTDTEGGCYAAELRTRFFAHADTLGEKDKEEFLKNYKSKLNQKIYFNVAKVDEPDKTYVFGVGIGSLVVKQLIKDVEKKGGITGVVYEVSKGAERNSPWTISRGDDYEGTLTAKPVPIKTIARFIPLAEQPRYLAKLEPEVEREPVPASTVTKPAASSDW